MVLAAILICGLLSPAFALSQTIPEGYTPIYIAEDLNNIRNDLAGKYILMNDIDLSAYENWEPIGTADAPFTGELDGNGFAVSSLKINAECDGDETYYFGLFGYAGGATIKNVVIINAVADVKYIGTGSATCRLGVLTGLISGTEIIDCAVSGKATANGFSVTETGGITGRASSWNGITNCVNYADVNIAINSAATKASVGGIAGLSRYSTLSQCCNYGNISVNGTDVTATCYTKVGGIEGNGSENLGILDCYNRGNVSADFSADKTFIGGISGESYITKNCYNTGEIILPENSDGYIGAISGNYPNSGLAVMPTWNMENVYYINENMVPAYASRQFPDTGEDSPFDNAKLLTDEEFKTQESFAGFDFENTWAMEENGYPVLKNQPKINIKESIKLELGKTYDTNAQTSAWTTTDESVAIVNEHGEITTWAAGAATISIEEPYGYITEYDITVTESISVDPIIPSPTPEPINSVTSAEIVCLPLKNRIVFGVGSPNTPEGIALKLTYKDGTEKTETITRTDNGYFAGDERIIGAVHVTVVQFGRLEEILYVNDETVKVEYDYFVIPPLRYILSEIYNILYLLFKF